VTVAQRFRAAWVDTNVPVPAGVELLPVRLARACVQVLPVDGASISVLTEDFRYPLGASDDTANAAERLQFTQGEGPCLDALRTNSPVQANAQDIYRRWPLLYGCHRSRCGRWHRGK